MPGRTGMVAYVIGNRRETGFLLEQFLVVRVPSRTTNVESALVARQQGEDIGLHRTDERAMAPTSLLKHYNSTT